MADIKQVADAADMIVNGYAFTRCTEGYRVLDHIGVRPQCGQLKPRMLKIQRFWAYILDFFI